MKKALVRNILLLVMSCVAFLCMLLPVLTLKGYYVSGSSNGFSCLSFSDRLMADFAPVCGVIMWLVLGCIITAIVFSIINLVKKNVTKGKMI